MLTATWDHPEFKLLRVIAFGAAFMIMVVPLHPFPDLSTFSTLGTWEVGDQLNQVIYTTLAALLLLMAGQVNSAPLLSQVTLGLIAVLAWIFVSVLYSQNPDLSFRRYGFTLIVMTIAATWLLLPLGLRNLASTLALIIGGILVACYAGVMLLPEFSIHQMHDLLEPQLYGNWRGIYGHKNEAGATMALFVLFGLFIARVLNRIVGSLIALASLIFLVLCAAKTSMILLPAIILMSLCCSRIQNFAGRATICLLPLFMLWALIAAACYRSDVAGILNLPFSDTSFTGRTDIWKFAIEHALDRPLTGHGFMAFWRTRDLPTTDAVASWTTLAAHSHNGYLDIALTTGLPGAALCILFVVILPISNYHKCLQFETNRALSLLLLQIWLFGIYVNCFESALFDRGNRIWFFLSTSVFGLHFLARYRVLP
jgi:O-antigen ligase